MAMLTKSFDTVQLGNRSDVCLLCAKKTGKRFAEVKNELKGQLLGKKVLRATSDVCYCLDCLEEVVTTAKEDTADKGVTI